MYQLLQTHLLNFFFRIFSAKAGTVACLFTGGTDMSSKFSSQVSVRISLQFQYIRHARRYHSVHFEDNLSSATPLWMSRLLRMLLMNSHPEYVKIVSQNWKFPFSYETMCFGFCFGFLSFFFCFVFSATVAGYRNCQRMKKTSLRSCISL